MIGSGIEAYREEVPGLVLGMYVDISMFIRIGARDGNAITETDEPIEVVVNIPEKLQSDGREYYIIRAHNGEYTFMDDIDDTPDTITVSTDLFSSYAIAYVETDGTDSATSARPSLGYALLRREKQDRLRGKHSGKKYSEARKRNEDGVRRLLKLKVYRNGATASARYTFFNVEIPKKVYKHT